MAKTRSLGVLMSALAATIVIGVASAGAQQRAVGVTPPRLSFLDGEVSYWRPGAEDWVPAQINTALAAGDSLYAGSSGNVELEIAARAYVRAGSGTELGVESLETGYLQLRLPLGHAALDLQRLPEGQEIEVDTPNGAFLINRSGYYRFDVDDAATRFSARRGGLARVVPAGDDVELEVSGNQTVMVTGTETARLERVAAVGDDAWDRWNYDRTAPLGEEPRSTRYVAAEVAGVDDLDRYGDWQDTPDYGSVWVPRGVAADWAPYTTGRWVWDGYYGWTWVDDSPWGWAPYHYGRWCRVGSYWGWAPGPIVARPVYSPALVAFFGGGGVGVSVSVGNPFVSWVALGWGEPVVPWWGPRGFVGRPYWGGWGGPRYVNNVRIQNTTIINVNNIHRYDNFRHRAVVGIDGDRFGRGRGQHVRVDGDRLRNLRPVRGELGVRPVRESLVPRRDGRGERPPDRFQNRRVVATRAPQDPSRAPRAAGLVPSDSRRRPEPRLVTPRSARGGSRELRGAGRDVPPARGTGGERQRIDNRDARGRNVEERTRDTGRVERVPGGRDDARGNAVRTAPQPPAAGRRIQNDADRGSRGGERDRSGGAVGRSIERRGTDRAPTPPPSNRNAERTRPDRARGQEPRVPGRPQDGGQGRVERPARTETQRAPRAERPQPPRDDQARERGRQRIEQPRQQPQRMPQMEPQRRQERQSRGSSVDRSMQRQSAPRPQRQEAPRVQRQAQPRAQRQEAPRVQRQAQPRAQRQQQPRMDRGGGGEPRGGGNERGGGGRSRDGGGGRPGRD